MAFFSENFGALPLEDLVKTSEAMPESAVETVMRRGFARDLQEFAALLSPAAERRLEELAGLSQRVTQRHYGKTIRLFAPLYLSNECVNICRYCGFSRHNAIPRKTLPVDQVVRETEKLARQGFRSLLLVAGEHPKYVSNGYVREVVERCLRVMPGISLELGPLETPAYAPLVAAGCENLVVYQETYHQPTYRNLHLAGPKKHFHWRMDTPERAYAAGFRRLGIGALFGLYDWRFDALAVAAHARHLLSHCWRAQVSISLPRMRPAAGGWTPEIRHSMSDRALVQTLAAFRLFLPHVGLVLSTRESPALRDGLVPIGITTMSAGASTEPGGYSDFDETSWKRTREQPGEQFHIADERPPSAVAAMIRSKGYEPVWKDFDQSFVLENPYAA